MVLFYETRKKLLRNRYYRLCAKQEKLSRKVSRAWFRYSHFDWLITKYNDELLPNMTAEQICEYIKSREVEQKRGKKKVKKELR